MNFLRGPRGAPKVQKYIPLILWGLFTYYFSQNRRLGFGLFDIWLYKGFLLWCFLQPLDLLFILASVIDFLPSFSINDCLFSENRGFVDPLYPPFISIGQLLPDPPSPCQQWSALGNPHWGSPNPPLVSMSISIYERFLKPCEDCQSCQCWHPSWWPDLKTLLIWLWFMKTLPEEQRTHRLTPGGATCISKKFGHQVAPLCHIVILPGISLLTVSIDFVCSSIRVTSARSQPGLQLGSSTRVIN